MNDKIDAALNAFIDADAKRLKALAEANRASFRAEVAKNAYLNACAEEKKP